MSLVKCPNCEQDISEQAKKCPNCGMKLSKGKCYKKTISIMCIVIVLGILSVWGVLQFRSQQIANLESEAKKYYSKLDFEGVKDCYKKMNFWFCDTSEKEEILAYDIKVYKDAKNYYDRLKQVEDSLNNNSYSSLRNLLNTLKEPTSAFLNLEVNKKSEIGQYINNVRNNVMFSTFNSEFINSNKYDVDYWLTSGGYSMIISTYTSNLLEEVFPYIGGK